VISSYINRMRDKLRAGDLVLGAGITFSDPTVTEALAHWIDFFWIDLEHNPTTTEALLDHLIAARAGARHRSCGSRATMWAGQACA
jgi:2-keto-3-deoxy-L-rhamnonate aldolase RhmA